MLLACTRVASIKSGAESSRVRLVIIRFLSFSDQAVRVASCRPAADDRPRVGSASVTCRRRPEAGLARAPGQKARRDLGGGGSVFGASPDSLDAGPAKYSARDQGRVTACADV